MSALASRWLGVGLASALAVVTISLAVTGRLQLYINPAQTWFAVGMAVLALAGAIWSCTLPLGAEQDHGHDHGDHAGADGAAQEAGSGHAHRRRPIGVLVAVVGGAAASAVAVAALVLPPASLSVQLAMDRDTGTPPLFAGADDIVLGVADTSAFGVGEWSAVFATATDPDAYAGEQVVLTGFVTPAEDGDGLRLGRLVITHCVIDAQPASVPIEADGADAFATGDWIEVRGTIVADADGALTIDPESVTAVDAPDDPYEY